MVPWDGICQSESKCWRSEEKFVLREEKCARPNKNIKLKKSLQKSILFQSTKKHKKIYFSISLIRYFLDKRQALKLSKVWENLKLFETLNSKLLLLE